MENITKEQLIGKILDMRNAGYSFKGFVKVTSNLRGYFQVIKCTATGKLFKDTNGFSDNAIISLIQKGIVKVIEPTATSTKMSNTCNVSDLNVADCCLVRKYFNSKTIIFQPVTVIEKLNTGAAVVKSLIDGTTWSVNSNYEVKTNVKSWIVNEKKKAEAELAAAKLYLESIENISKLY
jgi:hypothetical protein